MHGKQYLGPECDVWSMGVILYTMLTATMPFDDSNFPKFMAKIEKGQYSEPHGLSDGKSCFDVSLEEMKCLFGHYLVNNVGKQQMW